MIKTVVTRFSQGYRTIPYPDGAPPEMPARFRGRPVFDAAKCPEHCRQCVDACPTQALAVVAGKIKLDLGRCLFCTDCADACPEKAITYSRDYRLTVRQASDLVVGTDQELKLAAALDGKLRRLYGRSLQLRQVCAGGCNGCESDINVLGTIGWDLSRFGISFAASPRHADGLLITGPVTNNMKQALRIAFDALPDPKIVIAVGACALSGGPYINHGEVNNGAAGVVPIDLFIPGCPPHPMTILDGLLRLLGKIETATSRVGELSR
ncbi:MAG: 4Fe-4S dicluster domain-containing protein [Phycisphaerae bacterium]